VGWRSRQLSLVLSRVPRVPPAGFLSQELSANRKKLGSWGGCSTQTGSVRSWIPFPTSPSPRLATGFVGSAPVVRTFPASLGGLADSNRSPRGEIATAPALPRLPGLPGWTDGTVGCERGGECLPMAIGPFSFSRRRGSPNRTVSRFAGLLIEAPPAIPAGHCLLPGP